MEELKRKQAGGNGVEVSMGIRERRVDHGCW